MKRMFSTDHIPVRHRFRACQEMNRELFGQSGMTQLGGDPFNMRTLSVGIGAIELHDLETSPVENVISPLHRREAAQMEGLVFNICKQGMIHNEQLGHVGIMRPGDACFADNRYARSCRYPCDSRFLAVVVPRERIERAIGPTSPYAGLVIEGDLAGASLARTFLGELVRVQERLSPEMAARMAETGIDLIIAGVAERLARETPRAVQESVLVQRAQAHIEANLGDPALDPPGVAAAVATSLRRLQNLFNGRGWHVSDWIWERRLVTSARRLADPGHAHLSIGALSRGCGFANQAHFAKRFRERFGVSPRDHRRSALAADTSS